MTAENSAVNFNSATVADLNGQLLNHYIAARCGNMGELSHNATTVESSF
nr:MAG TPA: hypothetical protein [Caudoviricetes sp.]